jgi:hypothetical protein
MDTFLGNFVGKIGDPFCRRAEKRGGGRSRRLRLAGVPPLAHPLYLSPGANVQAKTTIDH